jgi:DNA-binding NarL/FixJ family response regulator
MDGVEVVLVDPHDALREGLDVLLERHGIQTVATAATIAGAFEVLAGLHPDIAIVGIQLPDGSGLDLVRDLHVKRPEIAVLIYTGIEDVATLAEALEVGARGFVLKLGGIAQLVDALRLVARGGRYVDPAIRAILDVEVDGEPVLLTERERQVFELLSQGLTGEEIATRLTVSPETIRTHIRNGMEKLDAHTRTGAVVQALKTREIGPESSPAV